MDTRSPESQLMYEYLDLWSEFRYAKRRYYTNPCRTNIERCLDASKKYYAFTKNNKQIVQMSRKIFNPEYFDYIESVTISS